MSSRTYYEWHLVGYDSDPVPVTEQDIHVIADDMRDRATDASTVRDTLRRLSDLDGWRGEAAEEFAGKADDVLEDLGKVVDRYGDVAGALDWWAGAIGTARADTARAVQDAEDADRRVSANTVDVAGGPDPTPEQVSRQQAADGRKQAAEGDLSAAQTAMRNAMDALDDAAEAAKGKIDDAADIWDDGVWGNVKGFLRKGAEFVEFMCQALEVIGMILGAVILVLVLTVGAPLVLLVAAAALAVTVLAGHLFLKMVDEGDVTWKTIGMDLVNVALSVTGLRFAGSAGRAIAQLRGAVPALATRAGQVGRAAVIQRLSRGQVRLYENALRYANPTGALGRWARGIRVQADIADVEATQRVLSLLNRQPGTLSVLLRQDRELAQLHGLAKDMGGYSHLLPTLQRGYLRHADDVVRGLTALNTVSNGVQVYGAKDVADNIGDVVDYVRDIDLPSFHLGPVR